ncbi:hypothetical protein RYX51_22860 (plasmid) [Priestia filamentosa]|nr:hypothetical protein RYX51_22860 [Priestia filamentosa]
MKKITSVTPEQFRSITEDKRALKRFVHRPQNTKIEAKWSNLSPGKLSSLEENAVYLLQEGKTAKDKGKEVKPTVLMVSRDSEGKKVAYESEVGATFLQKAVKEMPLDIEALMNREKVQNLIRQYAIGNKEEEKFPELKMDKTLKDKNTFFFSVTPVDTNRDGDLKGNIDLETGRIKIYEREIIDGENWSENSWVLQKETNLQELIKGQDIAPAFDYAKEMSRKYETYLQAQKQETPERTDTILDRIIAEQNYFTFKEDLVQEHGLSEEEVKGIERQVMKAFHQGNEQTPEEKFKEAYKQQLQEALEEPQTEQTYKEQYKQEVLKQLGFSPSKEKLKEKEESKEKEKEKTTSGVQMKKETKEEREKRLQQMKEFESKQPFSKVYQLKKEVLKELKDLPLTDAQKAKLTQLEKALDQEKKSYDKEHSQEKGIKKFFKGAKEKKAAKKKRAEYELER